MQPTTKNPRTLLVEDDYLCGKVLQRQIEMLGYESIIAKTGKRAIELLQQETFSLILLDLGLPDYPGQQVIQAARQSKLNRKTPIIVNSAHADVEIESECLIQGANRVLMKPVPFEKLESVINQYLSNIHVANVFSIDNQGGNRCAIVDNANDLTKDDMQSMAKEFNLGETVFISHVGDKYVLRFFATKKEHPLCFHGVLGAAFYLHNVKKVRPVNLSAYQNDTPLTVFFENNSVSLSLPILSKVFRVMVDESLICQLLEIENHQLDRSLPLAIASAGNPKLFVPVATRQDLFAIKPQLRAIEKWCKRHGVNGIYAYSIDTEDSQADFVGRNFNPLFSHQEDVATGSAAAALCQLLTLSNGLFKSNYIIEQGTHLNSPSKIYVSIKDNVLEIKGEVSFFRVKAN